MKSIPLEVYYEPGEDEMLQECSNCFQVLVFGHACECIEALKPAPIPVPHELEQVTDAVMKLTELVSKLAEQVAQPRTLSAPKEHEARMIAALTQAQGDKGKLTLDYNALTEAAQNAASAADLPDLEQVHRNRMLEALPDDVADLLKRAQGIRLASKSVQEHKKAEALEQQAKQKLCAWWQVGQPNPDKPGDNAPSLADLKRRLGLE